MEPERQPRGVHNPQVVDLIALDASTDRVVLTMLEVRPWGSAPDQLRQLESKFNAYLSYVLDGHLARDYPQYAGRKVRFQLDCATPPGGGERPMLTAMRNFAAAEDLEFEVQLIGSDALGSSTRD
jgi:hypothetical protein